MDLSHGGGGLGLRMSKDQAQQEKRVIFELSKDLRCNFLKGFFVTVSQMTMRVGVSVLPFFIPIITIINLCVVLLINHSRMITSAGWLLKN